MLLRAYPFAGSGPAEREHLFDRLGLLIEQQRGVLPAPQLQPLREPLDTPALRSRQAALWASLQDCDVVRAVLGDLSAEYGYDDWMRLGDCSTAAAPAVALEAYARAHARQPGGRGSRAIAYAAYARGDYRASLDAWRSVGSDHLSGDELIAAVTTALAAGERDQASAWLVGYRARGETLDYRYWSLLGRSCNDAAAATAALERAVELHPDVDDYLRLAKVDQGPGREVQWLERAADLDRVSAALQLQLAYAYTRAGRAVSALTALERAAALDPDDMNVQVELGYAHWRAGHPALARRALERAWRADPTRLVLAQQLVYISQRLKQNDSARWFAEHVLDAPSAFTAAPSNEDPLTADERRFAFQRLHEDLGRRVTVNLDGFSGTRVGAGTSAAPAGSHYRSFSQIEADVRLGSPPIRDGSTLSAYARVLGDSGALHSALPSEDTMLGVGLRWKPWRRQVIYLAAENQTGLEDRSRRDMLLRASASFFNGGRYGDDWHPSHAGWISRNLYLDAAHYAKTDYSAFTADYRMSYHRRISTEQTVEPYGHVQFTGARDRRINRDLRGGLGLRWNLWYGATTYDAAPHKLSLGVEFQQAVETYLPERNGLFVTLGARW
jgi:adsorption protein A